MSENSLALYDEAIMPSTFDGMMKQADVLAKSGLLPQTVRTGAAAALEGFDFVGIELDAEYLEIARRRIEHAAMQPTLDGLL